MDKLNQRLVRVLLDNGAGLEARDDDATWLRTSVGTLGEHDACDKTKR
jgi:hypothetical protein